MYNAETSVLRHTPHSHSLNEARRVSPINDEPILSIGVITLFPTMVSEVVKHGVTQRGVRQGRLHLELENPRDHSENPYRSVDDCPYGGGPGMVLKYEPLYRSKEALLAKMASKQPKLIFLSPQGKPLRQENFRAWASVGAILFLCGRYEGIDERFLQQEVDEEWSLGDYILSGGELAAMVCIDAVAREIPGTLGNAESPLQESFKEGLLDYPHYTRPRVTRGCAVPAVLTSGDHGAIHRWRQKQALGNTWLKRPDLLEKKQLTDDEKRLLEEFKFDYYQ